MVKKRRAIGNNVNRKMVSARQTLGKLRRCRQAPRLPAPARLIGRGSGENPLWYSPLNSSFAFMIRILRTVTHTTGAYLLFMRRKETEMGNQLQSRLTQAVTMIRNSPPAKTVLAAFSGIVASNLFCAIANGTPPQWDLMFLLVSLAGLEALATAIHVHQHADKDSVVFVVAVALALGVNIIDARECRLHDAECAQLRQTVQQLNMQVQMQQNDVSTSHSIRYVSRGTAEANRKGDKFTDSLKTLNP